MGADSITTAQLDCCVVGLRIPCLFARCRRFASGRRALEPLAAVGRDVCKNDPTLDLGKSRAGLISVIVSGASPPVGFGGHTEYLRFRLVQS